MSIAKCYCAHLLGLSAEVITVEVDISNGLNAVSIVGLGDRAVEEAKDRISAAIKNSGFASPKQKNQKVVISLAPADVRKEGASFDLAMALAYLSAAGEVAFDSEKILFLGELSLEGTIRKVPGVLPMLCEIEKRGFRAAYVPADTREEASLAQGIPVYGVSSLQEMISILRGEIQPLRIEPSHAELFPHEYEAGHDMNLVRGNETAKRGLEIAAAGGHNLLMYGPPGTGKTMLAQSFSTILPPLTHEESIEVTCIHSAAKTLSGGLIRLPPFRSPHHTASYPAVVGGGSFPKPGEITLAHRGILFMDELPEFDRTVLEALREPLEARSITVSRAKGTLTFPAHCILIASMNPCPCGKPQGQGCTCLPSVLAAYRRRVSGPILDRIDLWVNVSKVDYEKLALRTVPAESSADIRRTVVSARAIQRARFQAHGIPKKLNGEMSAEDIETCIQMDDRARSFLKSAAQKLSLSGRSFHRIIKIARTVADLKGEGALNTQHILEALQYRQKMGEL